MLGSMLFPWFIWKRVKAKPVYLRNQFYYFLTRKQTVQSITLFSCFHLRLHFHGREEKTGQKTCWEDGSWTATFLKDSLTFDDVSCSDNSTKPTITSGNSFYTILWKTNSVWVNSQSLNYNFLSQDAKKFSFSSKLWRLRIAIMKRKARNWK